MRRHPKDTSRTVTSKEKMEQARRKRKDLPKNLSPHKSHVVTEPPKED